MNNSNHQTTNINKLKVLRSAQLSELLGISQTTLWRWRKDPTIQFPTPIALGPRVVAWKFMDIEAWLNNH
ncbi:AlpA family phage regulatory protein [Vibrio alginolyticus]|uniref:helix-turn-helix transcriptional regulator n=1 Tax=Vibrio alginolyticus TaxID=663 RepID=UPI00215C6EC5|nr:AlpA family phage regulatory protein [Vibrio alginolyticus]MCR9328420.1 AlpA family phage regulatory protein [Vibrio alginolyticus]MCR9356792.1 AlpA family phage regulatory protein [Vibrio alginolyticus]